MLTLQTLFFFIALLGVGWAYFLFTHKRGNSAANKFLALLMIVFSFLVIRQAPFSEELINMQKLLYFISQGFVFFIGPFVLLYVKHLSEQSVSGQEVFKHLSIGISVTIIMFCIFLSGINISAVNNINLLKITFFSFISLQILHLVYYLHTTKKMIALYEGGLYKYYSSLAKINLKWMKQFIRIVCFFALLILIMYFLILSGGYYVINNTADTLFIVLISTIILGIVIKSWRQPEIISGIYEEDSKYRTSPLTESDSNLLKEKLEQVMMGDHVFLDPELNLDQLAKILNSKPYLVSQFINQEFEQNFFNLINGFRIDYVLERIKKGELKHKTLTGIAYDSGFNSKSTFNRAFKKKMQCTPMEYHKSLQVK